MDFFFLPRRCLVCAEPLSSGVLCRPCQARYQRLEPPDPGLGPCPMCGQIRLAEADRCMDCSARPWTFPSLDGLVGYQDPGGELLRLYKFGGQTGLARVWAQEAAARILPLGPLVPVPPLRRNLWRRGWDPVEVFVRRLAKEAGVPVWRPLIRGASASQKTLGRTGRDENARQAYRLSPRGRRLLSSVPLVWLVDDVVTTGATVEACSRLLADAGAAEVRVFSLGLH